MPIRLRTVRLVRRDRRSRASDLSVDQDGSPTVTSEVETTTRPDTKTLEMCGTHPKSGPEFNMMRLELTRQARTQALSP